MATDTPPPPRDDDERYGRIAHDAYYEVDEAQHWADAMPYDRADWVRAAAAVLRERDAVQAELLDAARAVVDVIDRLPEFTMATVLKITGRTAVDRLRVAVEAAERAREMVD